jgi:itaconate CoA-transferase
VNRNKVILSLEQALALPYATHRFVEMGWRVIRLESPPENGENAGDPNRYIGEDLGFHDLHSYFIAPNTGKEAITINLKKKEGQQLLKKLIRDLKVDAFLCNTLPKRYKQLGIDFDTLSEANPDLIWCGISAMGPDYPDRAGYDPALQALLGFTYLTGETEGKPVPSGIPIIDLKAGDEAFTQVILAMLDQHTKPGGKEIHISMAQCAASWLITALPQLEFVKNESDLFSRSGNEHRSFIPCNVYPTRDGFVYLAIGNDTQWAKFTSLNGFEKLYSESRKTNEGRRIDKENIYVEIGAITGNFTTKEFSDMCLDINLSVAPVNSIREVAGLDFVKNYMIKTDIGSCGNREVNLSPASYNTDFLKDIKYKLKTAPRLGEHNDAILEECGFSKDEIKILACEKII